MEYLLLPTNLSVVSGATTKKTEKIPKGVIPPPVMTPKYDKNKNVQDCKKLIAENFDEHPGDVDDFFYPITIRDSIRFFKDFLKNRFALFGDYEDAIHSEHNFNFHSLLSANINVGHITPEEIIKTVTTPEMIKNIPMNSLEGYVRQVIGWREFIRGIYHNFDEVQSKSNFWNHKRKLNENWYTGKTGIPPLDDAIKKANRFGYCHHIERLMIISNIMLLLKFIRKKCFKWFMEMFVDSSDWVMGQMFMGWHNLAMVGYSQQKPYICGSNYLLKDE